MKKFSNHLQYYWWLYLLLLVIFVSMWLLIFTTLAQPKDNEKIAVASFCDDDGPQSLHYQLQVDIGKITNQPLEEVSLINSTNSDENTLGSLLLSRVYTCDVIILTKDIAKDNTVEAYFQPLSESVLQQYFSDIPSELIYYVNGKAYGFLLNAENQNSRFANSYDGEKECIIFLSGESVNIAGINDKGNATDDAAISVLKYFLEESNDAQS